MYREVRPTYTHTTDWKLPLNLAIGFHVLVALSAIFLPGLFNVRPKFEDIYTVDLVSMAEPAAPAAAPAAPPAAAKPAASKPAAVKPPPEPPPPKPAVPDEAVPVPEAAAPVEKPAPPEAISIKPMKRKVKKEVPPEEPKPEPEKVKEQVAKPDPKQKELDKLKRQKIAEAIRAEQEADEEARIAKEEAEQLRKMLDASQAKAAGQAASTSTSTKATGSAKASNASSALEKSYYAAIFSRLHAFWALPEFREWDPSLTAIVVITINQNGEILDSFFEQSSGDKVFDQYVKKTLQDAAPLPPIPAALNKERLELGLRFTPGNIQ